MAGKKGSRHTKKRVVQPDVCITGCGSPSIYSKGFCRRCYYRQSHITEKRRPYMKRWREANRDRTRKAQQRYYQQNTDKFRGYAARQKYDLTLDEYNALMLRPCAICGDASEVMDHNHTTNKIREPLCGLCNPGIGMFRESPELLRAAASYLERHRMGE